MTARTHDLFAFSSISVAVGRGFSPQMSLATMLVALGVTFVSGLAPDLDESTSALWKRLPAGSGSILSKVVTPVFGSHRFISHSLIGTWLFGLLLRHILMWTQSFLLVDINIIWWSGILGYGSHLVADSLTREGVPYFWPIPVKFGFPPISFFRIKTGGRIEKYIVFPGLLLINAGWIYFHYSIYVAFFRGLK